jgi:hypothetical protein
MFFIDAPYVSDFLKQTLLDSHLPLVDTPAALKFDLPAGINLLSEEEAIQSARDNDTLAIYTTSENTIGWIAEHLAFTGIPAKIELFKNKAKFRRLIQPLYPDFFFREVKLSELDDLEVSSIPFPFVIKPSVGFFSLGVHLVNSASEWPDTAKAIHAEVATIAGQYPDEVVNIDSFIIEQCIRGDEFAVDAYFNAEGEAVVLDILHHTFSSEADVSDRIYTTSKEIIEANLEEFTAFLNNIGQLSGVKNFPVHVELRREAGGQLLPIEVNPMRFGGWCSTPDLLYAAYGINPYLYYSRQQKPDWKQVLADKAGKLFSVVILDNSTGKSAEEIREFDYDKMLRCFEKPLELRKIDFHQYPVFAFVYVETRAENFAELEYILKSNLSEFVNTKS